MAVEWVRYELLDLAGRSLGWLGSPERPQTVTECSVEWSQYGQIHGSGSMQVAGKLDWNRLCVAPTRFVRGSTTAQYRRGVYLLAGGQRTVDRRWEEAPDGEHRLVVHEGTDVTLYGPEYRLSRVPVADPLDWPAGTPFTEAMVEILDMVGISDVAVTHSPLTMPAPMHFSPGMDAQDQPHNLLTVHNRLAEFINYWSLRFDLTGRATIAPYVHPRQRPRTLEFTPDPDADWYRGEVSEDEDVWDVPNMMVGVARRDPIEVAGEMVDQPPLVYVARNHNRGPHSFEKNGGVWVGPQSGPEEIDAHDMATLAAVMERKLAVASNSARKWQVQALWQNFAGSEVAHIEHGDINALGTVVRWAENVHDVAAPVSLTLEEVL